MCQVNFLVFNKAEIYRTRIMLLLSNNFKIRSRSNIFEIFAWTFCRRPRGTLLRHYTDKDNRITVVPNTIKFTEIESRVCVISFALYLSTLPAKNDKKNSTFLIYPLWKKKAHRSHWRSVIPCWINPVPANAAGHDKEIADIHTPEVRKIERYIFWAGQYYATTHMLFFS